MTSKPETDVSLADAIKLERQRCIDCVLTYAALRDQAAIALDKAGTEIVVTLHFILRPSSRVVLPDFGPRKRPLRRGWRSQPALFTPYGCA